MKLLQLPISVTAGDDDGDCDCYEYGTRRMESCLPDDLKDANTILWNELYESVETDILHQFIRVDGSRMYILIAKRSHKICDGELYAFYDEILVHGSICESSKLSTKHLFKIKKKADVFPSSTIH